MANLWKWLERILEMKDDPLPEVADVAIAVGCDVSRNGLWAGPYSAEIAYKCLDFFRDGGVKNILLAGGYSYNDGPTEAECMYNLIGSGVPRENIILEKESNRTYLNADLSLPIVESQGWKTVVIVAQQWHARRVKATFRKRWAGHGIQIFVVKARSNYGGGSQRRLDHFLRFVAWDIRAWLASIDRGYV